MIVRGIRRTDLYKIDPIEKLAQDYEWRDFFDRDGMEEYLETIGRAVIHKGRPILLGGFTQPRVGVAEIWALYDRRVQNPRLAPLLLRHMFKIREAICKDHGVWRIQSIVDAKYPLARHHLERLGHQVEGTKLSYWGPGHDGIEMSWIHPTLGKAA